MYCSVLKGLFSKYMRTIHIYIYNFMYIYIYVCVFVYKCVCVCVIYFLVPVSFHATS